MTAAHIVDPAHVLGNLRSEASPDIMRQLLQNMMNALLSADADQVCGAEWGQPSPGRVSQHNGYRHRPSTPASAPSTWPSRSYVREPTSRVAARAANEPKPP